MVPKIRLRVVSVFNQITRLIYYDVTAIKVILFLVVLLILTYFFVIWGCGSKLVYFWLDCHLQFFQFLGEKAPLGIANVSLYLSLSHQKGLKYQCHCLPPFRIFII